jgi:hypothetical protein
MSSSTEPLAFFPINPTRGHLEALGAVWMTQREAPFGTTVTPAAMGRLDRRVRNHLLALGQRSASAVAMAPLFLHDRWPPRALAGALALVHFAPEALIDPRGTLRVAGRFAVLDALRGGPSTLGEHLSFADPFLLDGCSAHAPVDAAMLVDLLRGAPDELRRAALVAAARWHRATSGPVVNAVEARMAEADPAEQRVAWYALGRIAGPEHLDGLSVEVWSRGAENDGTLTVAAAFGSARVVQELLARVAGDGAPRPAWLHALGLAGHVEAVAPLARIALEGPPAAAPAARHALYLLTGEAALLRPGEARSPILSRLAAESGRGRRVHLGRPFEASTDVMSHAWLRALAPSGSGRLANALPDWLLGGGYGAKSWPARSLGPVAAA